MKRMKDTKNLILHICEKITLFRHNESKMISNSSIMAYNNNKKVQDLENKKDKKIWRRKSKPYAQTTLC